MIFRCNFYKLLFSTKFQSPFKINHADLLDSNIKCFGMLQRYSDIIKNNKKHNGIVEKCQLFNIYLFVSNFRIIAIGKDKEISELVLKLFYHQNEHWSVKVIVIFHGVNLFAVSKLIFKQFEFLIWKISGFFSSKIQRKYS